MQVKQVPKLYTFRQQFIMGGPELLMLPHIVINTITFPFALQIKQWRVMLLCDLTCSKSHRFRPTCKIKYHCLGNKFWYLKLQIESFYYCNNVICIRFKPVGFRLPFERRCQTAIYLSCSLCIDEQYVIRMIMPY